MIIDHQIYSIFFIWIAMVFSIIFFIIRDKKSSDVIKIFYIFISIFIPFLGVVIVIFMKVINRYFAHK
ncbi:hypothetical protein FHS68_004811 [Dyadobacter arcticus]|uniref:Cardiolipin synthase N-terminal domain-containing protein n=1 Tax=Dyadobacter arcticus TaxID=1078754 RepID=A0ABX0URL2_9BACT|nr:hypothetical protein [Dyadobacter arcticus]